MSPRRNRPARPESGSAGRRRGTAPPVDEERLLRGVPRTQRFNDGDWLVRNVPASAATKPYRCPGCQQEIASGVPHVVAWPAGDRGGLVDRRHWHTGCWQARERRRG